MQKEEKSEKNSQFKHQSVSVVNILLWHNSRGF